MKDMPTAVRGTSLGAVWLGVARRILMQGSESTYDGRPILELAHSMLVITSPDPDDAIIARHGDPERLSWMHANFTQPERVAELGGAESYATRLYDYMHSGRDQIAWVIERLQRDPLSRSASITTFQPLTDAAYIPCVALLDCWIQDDALELVVYAHSIDFGTKGYANLVELAAIQQRVARALNLPVGKLVMTVKSAHIYAAEREVMASVCQSEA